MCVCDDDVVCLVLHFNSRSFMHAYGNKGARA